MNVVIGFGLFLIVAAGAMLMFGPRSIDVSGLTQATPDAVSKKAPETDPTPAPTPAIAPAKASPEVHGPSAPSFKNVNWADIRPETGKPLLLEFWATWCPPCRESIPHLNSIFAANQQRGLQVVGLTDESLSEVRSFVRRVPMNYYVGQDLGRQLHERFGVNGIPHAFLFNGEGKMVWEGHPGQLNEAIINRAFP